MVAREHFTPWLAERHAHVWNAIYDTANDPHATQDQVDEVCYYGWCFYVPYAWMAARFGVSTKTVQRAKDRYQRAYQARFGHAPPA